MQSFKEILTTLSPIDDIASLTLIDEEGNSVTLKNKPGTSGSVAVYFEVSKDNGEIDSSAAEAALRLYAEHTLDARRNPGRHPNIDRLLALIKDDASIRVVANHSDSMP
ncbi:MAG TPA: DUF2322 family protein [Gammaproteobacteria bacterium]|nr:DUF2322 family protein [Gammaproteobacteria bacterium]